MDIINLYENYNNYFNSEFKDIFKLCSEAASKKGYKLYLIGGLVRDMLLNKKSLDIDITVEGNAIEFAEILNNEHGAKISSIHPDFGTVKVELLGKKIDFASTRCEEYPNKGHLPKVGEIGCPLEKDVLRRDFTINSLALSLNKENFADLIDYVGGYKDLKNKNVKILHDKSFIDDPTRVIRGLKYSCRFNFELDEQTLKLQENYLANINYDMCYKRIKQEIKKTFSEDQAQCSFDKFIERGIYKLIVQSNTFSWHAELNSASYPFAKTEVSKYIIKYEPKHTWLIWLGLIALNQSDELLDKLELTKNEKNIILGAKSLINKTFIDDFQIYKAFCPLQLETHIILAALGREKEVIYYLENLRKIKLEISGEDIKKLGIKPSEKYGLALDFVLQEKIKNPKITKQDEIILIKKFFLLK